MIILEEDRTIILHTPKCAGKALRKAFAGMTSETEQWDWSYLRSTGEWVDRAHVPLSVLKQMPEWKKFSTWTFIAVVRDPRARLVSSLREHLLQHREKDPLAVLDRLDETRICHDPRYIHFIPQHRFSHIGNKRYADFIVRTESLAADLRAVGTLCRFGKNFFDAVDRIMKAPESRESGTAPDVAERITACLARFYIRDYALFGYAMPDFSGKLPGWFSGLLTDPLCWPEWSGYGCTEAAYDRFRRGVERDAMLNALLRENRTLRSQCEALRTGQMTA